MQVCMLPSPLCSIFFIHQGVSVVVWWVVGEGDGCKLIPKPLKNLHINLLIIELFEQFMVVRWWWVAVVVESNFSVQLKPGPLQL